MPDTLIVSTFVGLLQVFEGCFTAATFRSFVAVVCGWALAPGRRTVTGVVRAANAVGWKHLSSFHRFFSRARWSTDEVGLVLARTIIKACLRGTETIIVPVDDTLGRHTGKRIAAASLHYDPLLSTAQRALFHWGHLWVVVSIAVPAFGKVWALPVLFRLYRSKALCAAEGRIYQNCPELAAELIALLARAFPERRFVVVGDGAYTNSKLIKGRPNNVTIVGRSRLDAALYSPPPPYRRGQLGRPRVRGDKLLSPQERIQRGAQWKNTNIFVYGRAVTVQVFTINALWYVAAGSEIVRMVVVRGFPGHDRDDVFLSTDPHMKPSVIIETFSLRWSLEVTFHEGKGKLGFEHPQNRNEQAVHRTAPVALWVYSLVVLWYLLCGARSRFAKTTILPWYTKTAPTFSDMLATLKRASWIRLLDPHSKASTMRKRIRPFLDAMAA